MPIIPRDRSYTKSNFLVEIAGIPAASFVECHGLEFRTDIIEYREGGDIYNRVRKLPGLTKYSNIVLKRGIGTNGYQQLYDWLNGVAKGHAELKEFDIILLDEARQPVARWHFRSAWPCRISGPDLNALDSGVAIEELEICHEGFEMV